MFNKLSLNFAAFLSEQPGPPQAIDLSFNSKLNI